jgi:hypothetical protein
MHAASRKPNKISAAKPAESMKLSIGFLFYSMAATARCILACARPLE